MNYYLYICLGEKYAKEALYSIASYKHFLKEDQIIYILCDLDSIWIFSDILCDKIKLEVLDKTFIKEYFSHSSNLYRIKIKGLEYFLKKYNSKVLLLDTDTMAINDISHYFNIINKNKFIMFNKYYSMSDYLNNVENPEIKTEGMIFQNLINGFYYENKKIIYNSNWFSCNSGVIGISSESIHILDEVDKVCEMIFNYFNYSAAEELAYSLVFQNYGNIVESDQDIFHYSSPTIKFARLFVGYIFDCLLDDDKRELEIFLRERKLGSLDRYGLEQDNIYFFIHFIDKVLKKSEMEINTTVKLPHSKYEHMYMYRKFLKIYKNKYIGG